MLGLGAGLDEFKVGEAVGLDNLVDEDVAGVVVLFTGAVLDLLDVAVALVFCVEANGDGAVSKKLMSWALPAKTASSFRRLLVTIL